jgi:hypothetical protein
MKKFIIFATLVVIAFAFWSCQEALGPEAESNALPPMIESTSWTPPDCGDACVRSPGYWKNHLDMWPDEVPGPDNDWYDQWTGYTKEDLQTMMTTNGMNKNKWYTMFKAVVAAKLDLEILGTAHCEVMFLGQKTCICQIAQIGFNWLYAHDHQTKDVKANSLCWQYHKGEKVYLLLDDYYNGKLCVPACD